MDAAALSYLFSPVGPITVRRMFGGLGIYKDGLMFALEAERITYIKAAPGDHAELAALGSSPFSFERREGEGRKVMVTSYWSLPSDAFEDPEIVLHWAGRAIAAAKAAQGKPRRKR